MYFFLQKSDGVDLELVLSRASCDQLSGLWSSWHCWIAQDTLSLVGTREQAGTEARDAEEEKVAALATSRLTLLIAFARWTLSPTAAPDPVPEPLQQSCLLLHGLLLSSSSSVDPLKNPISHLCETWYLQKLDGWEDLVGNTITYLTKRALANTGVVSSG